MSTPNRLTSEVGFYGRFGDRIDASGDCWVWTGDVGKGGYGRTGAKWAHRVVFEVLVGPIEEGLWLDHLCRNRLCVNPDHLEPTSRRENILRGYSPTGLNVRKTHCPRGHALPPVGHPRRGRTCGECKRSRPRVAA